MLEADEQNHSGLHLTPHHLLIFFISKMNEVKLCFNKAPLFVRNKA